MDETQQFLASLSARNLPFMYDSGTLGLRAMTRPQGDMFPEAYASSIPEYLRVRKSIDSPLGLLGLSIGNEPSQELVKAAYNAQINVPGGLLGVDVEGGKQGKKASAKYIAESMPLSVTATKGTGDFGEKISSLEAAYAIELAKNWLMGMYGSVGSSPNVGLRLQGRF